MRSFMLASILAFFVSAAAIASPKSPEVVHHEIELSIDVKSKSIKVKDRVTLPASLADVMFFRLHKGLSPKVNGRALNTKASMGAASMHSKSMKGSLDFEPKQKLAETYVLSKHSEQVVIEYEGPLNHAPKSAIEGERSFAQSAAVIDDKGLYLSGQSFWFPRFGDELFTYSIKVRGLDKNWSAFSAGQKKSNLFESKNPLDDIHLVAGPFTRFEESLGAVKAVALLRSNDAALANKYLSVTERYLKMYEALIGPYPYKQFALIENFWETGYGMPAFTLLGPKVIRFPFILHSSYPHELLHNWWGNSVFLDEGGNWCEGLTAYLADHLVQSQRGKGDAYRRRALERYRDFGQGKGEFALSQFRSRYDNQSEAIGYAKWSMVLHTLRQKLGDDTFIEGLRAFYKTHRFSRASFSDLREAFENASQQDLGAFFMRYVEQSGAPNVRYSHTETARKSASAPFVSHVTLEQVGQVFPLEVPFYVTTADETSGPHYARFTSGSLARSEAIVTKSKPLSLSVDPRFDVFRLIDPLENAPTLSNVLGAKEKRFIIPTFSKSEEQAWRDFAKSICGKDRCTYEKDHLAKDFRDNETVVVLGFANRLRALAVVGARKNAGDYSDAATEIFGERYGHGEHSMALTFRHPNTPRTSVAFIAAPSLKAIEGLARKLPHYGKYSALVFKGDAPDNVQKGIYDNTSSPLFIALDKNASPKSVRLPREKPLAELPEIFSEKPLLKEVAALSEKGRAPGSLGLRIAKDRVSAAMNIIGLKTPATLKAMHQKCRENNDANCALVFEIPGKDKSLAPVVLGAHIDHLGGKGVFPGANDNASGVAVALASAKALAGEGPYERSIHVVFFDGEEAGLLGSKAYLSAQKTKPFAMVNLDMVGAQTQKGFFVLGHESASEWMHIFHGVSFVTGVKTTLGAKGLGASDHVSFLKANIPAIHLFGGPVNTYHRRSDTPSKVSGRSLVDAALLTLETTKYLASRKAAMHTNFGEKDNHATSAPAPKGARKVSLGVVPDFAYRGQGVRLKDVQKGSPAAKSGLKGGDIIVAINGTSLADLRSLSMILRAQKPGSKLQLRVKRGAVTIETSVSLVAR